MLEAIVHSAQHLADAIANAGQGLEWYLRVGRGADKAQTHGARTGQKNTTSEPTQGVLSSTSRNRPVSECTTPTEYATVRWHRSHGEEWEEERIQWERRALTLAADRCAVGLPVDLLWRRRENAIITDSQIVNRLTSVAIFMLITRSIV